MSNDEKETNVYERLWKLWAMICKMIMDETRDPWKVVAIFQTIVDGAAKTYLRRILSHELIFIMLTRGGDKSSDGNGTGVFSAGVSDFNLLGVTVGRPTDVTNIAVYETAVHDTKFPGSFGSLSRDLNRLRLEWNQVWEFCRVWRDKVCSKEFSTFFLLTRDGEPVNEDYSNVFIAEAYFNPVGLLKGFIFPFTHDFLLRGRDRHRLVVPEQE